MKISVIIPVYKTALTLERCVRSVVEQEGGSLDVLLIDDGSPDACPELCDRLSRRYDCITVVHKPNGGLSDARNHGIERASGDRLMFVDSDDILARGTIKHIVNVLSQHPEYDILEFPVRRFYGSRRESLLSFDDREYTDMRDYWLSCKAYAHTYACNKVYRRELFDGVSFPVGKVFEDVYTLPLLLEKARIVATMSRGCYHYCYNPQGITATADAQAQRDLLEAHLRLLPHFDFSTPQEQEYYMHILNIQITESERSGLPPRFPDIRISPSAVSRRFLIKALLLRLLGVKGLCQLNRLFKNAMRKNPSREMKE